MQNIETCIDSLLLDPSSVSRTGILQLEILFTIQTFIPGAKAQVRTPNCLRTVMYVPHEQ